MSRCDTSLDYKVNAPLLCLICASLVYRNVALNSYIIHDPVSSRFCIEKSTHSNDK